MKRSYKISKDVIKILGDITNDAIVNAYPLLLISSIICTFCMTICIIIHFTTGFSMDNKTFLELVLPSIIIYIFLYKSYKLRKLEK